MSFTVIKHIICELTGYRPGTVDVSQGDRGSRAVSCRLMESGAPWMIPEGAAARVAYTLPDGTEGLYDRRPDGTPLWEIAGNIVTVELADQLMAQAGMVQMSILIIGPEGGQLATWPIRVMVSANKAARLTVPEGMPPYGAGFAGKIFFGGADGTVTPLGIGEGVEIVRQEDGSYALVAYGGAGGGGIKEETDPTVADWAKAGRPKPYGPENAPPYPVTSVNGKTGALALTAEDVGALPQGTKIPGKTSELTNDAGFVSSDQAQALIAAVTYALTPQMYGAVGDGETDDTAAIQAMFDAVGDGGLIYFPAGTYVVRHSDTKTGEDYVAVTVRGRHGLRVVLAGDALIKHKAAGVGRYTMLRFEDCDGVEISGGIIEGDRQEHQAVSSGYGSKGIHIVNSSNIHIHDMEVRSIWGDCIGATGMAMQCDNVLIENCDLHDSYRNGITIGGARNSTVRNCHIYGIVGGDPQAGIDLEAEWGIPNTDITIDGSYIHDCARNAIAFSSNGTGTRVRGCRLDGNTLFDNTHTGVEITGTTITGTANFQNDVVLRGCSVTAVGCYDTTDNPGVSLTAYNTIFKGNDGTPTININGINGVATLRLVGCSLNQPESSAYALIYSYNATDIDVEMDGCVVNLRNGTALHRQLAHGKYRAFSMAGCTIAVRSATMDYSFIRTDADQVRISNCTIDLSGVESYNPAEIGYFWNRNSVIEFNGNVILNTVAISNVLCLEGFTGTAHITNNTAPMCGAMVKVAGSSGTVVQKGNITANSAEGGGADGITPHIGANGNWYIGATDTGVKAQGTDGAPGDPGRGIASVERTSGNGAAGTVDTYTITYTDGTTSTYQVRNGADGKDAPAIETQVWTFTMTDGSVVEMEVAARAVQ